MLVHEIAGIATLFVVGAIVIAAISKNAATSSVLGASFQGFAQDIAAMQAPVLGGNSATG